MLALQQTAGNQAVARALRGSAIRRQLQRAGVRVSRIDFDPTATAAQAWRHGHIEPAFWTALQNALFEDDALDTDKKKRDFRNQLDNVMKPLKTGDHEGTDIPTLAGVIADRLIAGYLQKGLGAASTKRDLFIGHITTELVKHIEKSPTKDMDAGEAYGFDLMKKAVEAGGGQMSRRKGAPSTLPRTRLPAELESSIKQWRTGWVKETRRWTAAGLAQSSCFRGDRDDRRQAPEEREPLPGRPPNNAGGCPAIPRSTMSTPCSRPPTRRRAPGLKAKLDQPYPAKALGMDSPGYDLVDADRAEYVQRINAAKAGLTHGQLRRSVWAALAAGVSPYIEFSTTDYISRMVYDCVGDSVYVSAHYKWREGYNPWFEVEDWNE